MRKEKEDIEKRSYLKKERKKKKERVKFEFYS